MNVFTFLGLPSDHRKKDKVVQLVKHYDEVPESRKKWPMYLEIKYDGVFSLIVKYNDKLAVFSRTGMQLNNAHIPRMPHIKEDGVYIAEFCNDTVSLEVHSGRVSPNRVELLEPEAAANHFRSAYYKIPDYLTIGEFLAGHSPRKYGKRKATLLRLFNNGAVPYYQVNNEDEAHILLKKMVAMGLEGIVLKQEEGWFAGHKGFRAMKLVRGVSYDLECIDYEEGKGKYKGKIANLIFRWKNGKTVKAMLGRGYTHVDAEQMLRAVEFGTDASPIGKIFAVYALQESSKGVLRLPKVGELRHDKPKADK